MSRTLCLMSRLADSCRRVKLADRGGTSTTVGTKPWSNLGQTQSITSDGFRLMSHRPVVVCSEVRAAAGGHALESQDREATESLRSFAESSF